MAVAVYQTTIPTLTQEQVAQLHTARILVDPARLLEIDRFANPHDRTVRLVSSLLLRYAVIQQIDDAPLPCQVARDAFGKPYLPQLPAWYISMSHSGNHVFCALGKAPLGIDVECVRAVAPNVKARVCTPQEQQWLTTQPETAFIELWTRKEAVVKALGMGLRIPLSTVEVHQQMVSYHGQDYGLYALQSPEKTYASLCVHGEIDEVVIQCTVDLWELLK